MTSLQRNDMKLTTNMKQRLREIVPQFFAMELFPYDNPDLACFTVVEITNLQRDGGILLSVFVGYF